MGYSCAAKASYTRDAIIELIAVRISNGMPDGGFFETGREQADGAITGTVWKPTGDGHVTKRGGFRIEADGRVSRFPGLPATLLRTAETIGETQFKANHGTWRERGAALLADLEANRTNAVKSWPSFESVFQGWQRENKIMFAAMPHPTNPELIAALTGMLG
jgi:hypothetical protein